MAKVKLPKYQRTQLTAGPWGTGDLNYESNVMLLPFTGLNGSTSQRDQSISAHPMTFAGSAALDTDQSRFGGLSSVLLNGSTDYVTTPDTTALRFGAGDWTVEGHFRFASIAARGTLLSKWDSQSGTDAPSWVISWFQSTSELRLDWAIDTSGSGGNGGIMTRTWSPSADVWYHMAIARDSDIVRMFIEGTQIGTDYTGMSGQTIYNAVAEFEVGVAQFGSGRTFFFNGHIDNVRLTKGLARYTKAFTPPDAPFANYKPRVKLAV